jgi:hypothetical protein
VRSYAVAFFLKFPALVNTCSLRCKQNDSYPE